MIISGIRIKTLWIRNTDILKSVFLAGYNSAQNSVLGSDPECLGGLLKVGLCILQ
jgi:hypothetical protein